MPKVAYRYETDYPKKETLRVDSYAALSVRQITKIFSNSDVICL